METVSSLYGLYVSCEIGQEQEYKDYMEDVLPLFHEMSKLVKLGTYQGDYIRSFSSQSRNKDGFLLYVGISHNQMFIGCGTINNDNDIYIKNHCKFSELKQFRISKIQFIKDMVGNMANIDLVKTPNIIKGKLNEKWSMLTAHYRSLR